MSPRILVVFAGVIVVYSIVKLRQRVLNIHNKKTMDKSSSRSNKAFEALSDKVNQHNNEMIALSEVFSYVPFLKLTNSRRKKLSDLIAYADAKNGTTLEIPEEVHVKQCIWFFASLAFIIIFCIKSSLSIILLPATYLFYIHPLKKYYKTIDDSVSVVDSEILDFYDLYYIQFRKKDANISLLDLSQSYLGLASPEMENLLARFIADLSSGDEFALNKLNERYKDSKWIGKFCNVAKLRSSGDPASYNLMDSLHSEIIEEMKLQKQKADDKAFAKSEQLITLVLEVSILILIILIFAIDYVTPEAIKSVLG
jgi:hypothetical protein